MTAFENGLRRLSTLTVQGSADTAIDQVRIDVAEPVLSDLRQRLAQTRWPEAEPVPDWSQGVPMAYLQTFCRYWAESYDWFATQARLNALPQFRTEIDSLGIYFVHLRSAEPAARPLLLSHGWPGSVLEFAKVLGPLSDPRAHGAESKPAFHLVCPALPGYGFSDRPQTTGWSVERIADAWAMLMSRLGYSRYYAQGGDWGAAVTTAIAVRDPAHCAGIHLNMPVVRPDRDTMAALSSEEQQALAALKHYRQWESGYSKQQSTRPQTIGYALTDSPVGQAAWILEKFCAWMDCDGHPENVLSRDELIDNIMLYWIPRTAASSARLYWESFGKLVSDDPVSVPSGFSLYPKEIFKTSKRWAQKRFSNIVHWNYMKRGGHFAALEQPALFVDEIRAWMHAVDEQSGPNSSPVSRPSE